MKVQNRRFLRAKALHLAGDLYAAEAVYLQILERNPADTESLQLLGLVHADTGRTDTAVQLLRAAIGIEGPKPWLCRNLGIVFERRGELAAAAACYRQALAEAPLDRDLWAALAKTLATLERHHESVEAWSNAVQSASCSDENRLSFANALVLTGQLAEAIEQYDALLRQKPGHTDGTFNRAVAYMQQNESLKAMDGFARTLELDPRHAQAANNLGILHQLNKNLTQAIPFYQQAIRSQPGFCASIYNLGTAWLDSHRVGNAVAVFRKVLKLQPEHTGAWTNLGNANLARNQTSDAIDCYRTALKISPGDAAAEWNLGVVSLLIGDFATGWRGYERRFEVKGSPGRRPFTTPLWQGEPLAGKTLLLHAEQGLGDTLQFVRYAAVFQAQGAKTVIECQAALLPLLAESDPASKWIAAPNRPPGSTDVAPVDHLPPADYQLPMMSAPERAATRLDSIPAPQGYLRAPAAASKRWKNWLGSGRGRTLRVGLCWAGNPNHKNDQNRSISPELLSNLETPGVEWVNLQVGRPMVAALEMRNAAREIRDFSDSAGLIENLDLVVSVDSSVAHLAGALGKPVWVLLPFAPDWRWLLDRADSPWYAAARLFRQSEPGNWSEVLRRVSRELSKGAILKA